MRKVLLIGAATAVLMAAGVTAVVQRSFADESYRVEAFFTKAIGLFEQSDVRVLGVAVGKVTQVTPVGDRVRVVMEIGNHIKIPTDAIATIVPISLISDRYIQLSPPYQSGPYLRDGSTLDVSRTRIPAELDDVLANLEKLFIALEAGRESDPGALGDAITNLAAALKGTGADLDQTLGSAGTISKVINDQAEHLDSLIARSSAVLSALSQRRDEIAELNRDLSTVLGAVAEEQSGLSGTLTGLALLTEQVGDLIKDHRGNLEADLSTLSRTTGAVVRQQDSLIRGIDWLHVLNKGGEHSIDGQGIVHKQSNGVIHIDVRDVHGTPPCPVPFLGCQISSSPFGASAPRQSASVSATAPLVPDLQLEPSGAARPESPMATKDAAGPKSQDGLQGVFITIGDLLSSLWDWNR